MDRSAIYQALNFDRKAISIIEASEVVRGLACLTEYRQVREALAPIDLSLLSDKEQAEADWAILRTMSSSAEFESWLLQQFSVKREPKEWSYLARSKTDSMTGGLMLFVYMRTMEWDRYLLPKVSEPHDLARLLAASQALFLITCHVNNVPEEVKGNFDKIPPGHDDMVKLRWFCESIMEKILAGLPESFGDGEDFWSDFRRVNSLIKSLLTPIHHALHDPFFEMGDMSLLEKLRVRIKRNLETFLQAQPPVKDVQRLLNEEGFDQLPVVGRLNTWALTAIQNAAEIAEIRAVMEVFSNREIIRAAYAKAVSLQ